MPKTQTDKPLALKPGSAKQGEEPKVRKKTLSRIQRTLAHMETTQTMVLLREITQSEGTLRKAFWRSVCTNAWHSEDAATG